MKRKQKKARTKAMKQRQKAAKQAPRPGSGQAHAGDAPLAKDAAVAVAETVERPVVRDAERPVLSETRAPGGSEPRQNASPEPSQSSEGFDAALVQAAERARAGVAVASENVDDADGELTDKVARGMLVRAARFLSKVIEVTYEAVKDVPAKRLAEAFEIATAKPERGEGNAQRRPRRGTDPLVTIIKVGIDAVKQVQRVLARTNPELGRLKRA